LGIALAGVVDEDSPHRLGRRREEVSAAIPIGEPVWFHQPQECLVHQFGRLETMAGALAGQSRSCDAAQLVVQHAEQVVSGLLVVVLQPPQQERNLRWRSA
jgi:hypothetical protein